MHKARHANEKVTMVTVQELPCQKEPAGFAVSVCKAAPVGYRVPAG